MTAETERNRLIAEMCPQMLPDTYVFCTLKASEDGLRPDLKPLASFSEAEGLSLVVTRDAAAREGLVHSGPFRCITLQVYSSLEAVGLTAAVAGAVVAPRIRANAISGYHHDHVLVPSGDAARAIQLLKAMCARV